MVEKGASAVVDKVAQLKTFDAVSDLAEPFVIDVFPNAIGLSQEGRENLLPYGAMILNAFGPANDILAASARDRVALTEWLMKSCRRENLMPGGIGAEIYGAVDRGEITESEAPMLMRSLLGGGLDTTVYGIANLVWCFARYPTEWDKVKADPTRIRVAIDEATRLLPVLLTPFRTTTRAVKLAGVEIAENEKILLLIGSANRDPHRWQDPDVFNVDRKVTGHVGFGAGVHGCIGQMISKMETEVLMQTFVKVVKRITPAGDAPVLRHNTIGSFSSVPVRVETEDA
jgi:cytochrome P450